MIVLQQKLEKYRAISAKRKLILTIFNSFVSLPCVRHFEKAMFFKIKSQMINCSHMNTFMLTLKSILKY